MIPIAEEKLDVSPTIIQTNKTKKKEGHKKTSEGMRTSKKGINVIQNGVIRLKYHGKKKNQIQYSGDKRTKGITTNDNAKKKKLR